MMPKKETNGQAPSGSGKLYAFAEYAESETRVQLLDGKPRRIRITLATVKRFEHLPLVSGSGDAARLDFDQVANLLWDILLDKEDLPDKEALFSLMTLGMLPDLVWMVKEACESEGDQLKNGFARIQKRLNGPAPMPSQESTSDSNRMSSGVTLPANMPV